MGAKERLGVMNPTRLYVVHIVFSILPTTRCFRFKCFLLRWAGAVIGTNVRIVSSARFHLTGNLKIGNGTWIGHETLIIGGDADVTIGNNVDIAPRVLIVSGTHELFTVPFRAAGRGYSLPISIEDGVWIGAGATILGGVRVGECCMIAAGALVNIDVTPRCVVGGIPIRVIKTTRTNSEVGSAR